MPDVLIRDVPAEDLAALEARASKLGLSRNEFLRRQLHREARQATRPVEVGDFESLAMLFADLSDPDVMSRAWSSPIDEPLE